MNVASATTIAGSPARIVVAIVAVGSGNERSVSTIKARRIPHDRGTRPRPGRWSHRRRSIR